MSLLDCLFRVDTMFPYIMDIGYSLARLLVACLWDLFGFWVLGSCILRSLDYVLVLLCPGCGFMFYLLLVCLLPCLWGLVVAWLVGFAYMW